ncbi:28877_t:CDS:2 [Dentiscutata erythropus]|uniref:28877_t:CDS:1 n=1 Tax=Dentiscutata erythropus TaxID=1348616 RepID=A0A9N9ABI1_9GLOM|nr:28877_t:CDS:2 [Dentiscutata erythropus]
MKEEWFRQKPKTIANQKGCTIGEVNQKRGEYFLLKNYLLNQKSDEAKYFKKYSNICHRRVSELIEIIGENFIDLPIPTNFFDGRHVETKKIKALINWFKNKSQENKDSEEEYSEENYNENSSDTLSDGSEV